MCLPQKDKTEHEFFPSVQWNATATNSTREAAAVY